MSPLENAADVKFLLSRLTLALSIFDFINCSYREYSMQL